MERVEFKDNKTYKNVEIGAGCGNFGKQYYPKCYLTDKDTSLKTICAKCLIDLFCDAHSLRWKENRFEKIILCNPYGYGFKDEEEANTLFAELHRVAVNNAEIIIICNETNRYCNPSRVKTRLNNFVTKNPNSRIHLSQEVSLDRKTDYPNYIFKTLLGEETKPTKRIVLNVEK